MRIGVLSRELYPYFYGGIGVQLALMAETIVSYGHTVEFFTALPSGMPESSLKSVCDGVRIHTIGVDESLSSVPTLAFSAAADEYIRACHSQTPLDALVVTEFGGESFFLQLRAICRPEEFPVPIVMTLHGASREVMRHNRRQLGELDEIVCLQEEIAILCSNLCVAPSRTYWEELGCRLPLYDVPIRIMPNLCDERIFQPMAPPSGPVQGAKNIVFIGRLEPLKGVDLIFEAFKVVAGAYPDSHLHFVGRDMFWPAYNETFSEYCSKNLPPDLRSRVVFHGQIPSAEVGVLLRSAYVAVLPSRWETFGIGALEAMAAGVPVIVSAGTGLEAVVGNQYELVVGPPCDAERLEESLVRILSDGELRSRLSAVVKTRAQEVLKEGRHSIRALLSEIEAKNPRPHPAVPLELVAELFRHVWKFGEGSHARLKTLLIARDREIRELTDEVLRQNSIILSRDSMILERDEVIAALRGEIESFRTGARGIGQTASAKTPRR